MPLHTLSKFECVGELKTNKILGKQRLTLSRLPRCATHRLLLILVCLDGKKNQIISLENTFQRSGGAQYLGTLVH